MIQPGQIYRSLNPRDRGFRIRIVEVGASSARAVDASNGRALLNRIMLHSLHATSPWNSRSRSSRPQTPGADHEDRRTTKAPSVPHLLDAPLHMATSPIMRFAAVSDAVREPCPSCKCWGLRSYTADDGSKKIVCLNGNCTDARYKPKLPA